MSSGVLVGMASIPSREEAMLRVVATLAPQADQLALALNGYDEIPAALAQWPQVVPTLVPEPNGGDAEKFAAVDGWDGYVLTCDDDVLYPPGYVTSLCERIAHYDLQRACSYHGGTTGGYTGHAAAATVKRHRCLGALAADDTDVNVVGTGTLGYHTAAVPLWRDVFRHPNMADVHMACHARTFGIPLAVLAHSAGWLEDICPARGPRIYEANARGDGSPQDTRRQRQALLAQHDWASPAPGRPHVRVSIATCERPQLLLDLLYDLDREGQWLDLEVAVYDDASTADYTAARVLAEGLGWEWHRQGRRRGKAGHWQLVNDELRGCQTSTADWFVFLPDDVRLVRHALPRALATWHLLDDPAALTLWRLRDQEDRPNWTGRRPVDRGDAWECYHVDGLYLCQRAALAAVGWHLRPVQRSAALSSGVGRQMSLALHRQGLRMYRVPTSLAIPEQVPSVMNPDAADRVHEWQYI